MLWLQGRGALPLGKATSRQGKAKVSERDSELMNFKALNSQKDIKYGNFGNNLICNLPFDSHICLCVMMHHFVLQGPSLPCLPG